jgi:osmotically-inducible protein OsmY
MKSLQLCCGAAALLLVTGCQRGATQADVKQDAAALKTQTQQAASDAGAKLADGWLTTKIKSKYVADRDLKATDINVSSRDGVVTLSGRVLNDPMRSLAVTIAQNTDGVKQVVNQLGVTVAAPVPKSAENATPSTPAAVATSGTVDTASPVAGYDDDASITSTIQSKFFLDDKIKGRQINVQSSNGIVTLNGDLRDEVERGEALLLARTTSGVQRVEDNLTVSGESAAAPAASASSPAPASSASSASSAAPAVAPAPASAGADDSTLVSRVQQQLAGDAQTKRVEVTAKSGVVLLQGNVPTAAAKQHALSAARTTEGVTQVVDRIHIGAAKK